MFPMKFLPFNRIPFSPNAGLMDALKDIRGSFIEILGDQKHVYESQRNLGKTKRLQYHVMDTLASQQGFMRRFFANASVFGIGIAQKRIKRNEESKNNHFAP